MFSAPFTSPQFKSRASCMSRFICRLYFLHWQWLSSCALRICATSKLENVLMRLPKVIFNRIPLSDRIIFNLSLLLFWQLQQQLSQIVPLDFDLVFQSARWWTTSRPGGTATEIVSVNSDCSSFGACHSWNHTFFSGPLEGWIFDEMNRLHILMLCEKVYGTARERERESEETTSSHTSSVLWLFALWH